MGPVQRATRKLAVVITDLDGEPACALMAKDFGFTVKIPRYPSVEALAQRLPDLILVDWSPSRSAIEKNTALVSDIRDTAAIANVPIFVFYSFKDDVPKSVSSAPSVLALEIPFSHEVFERALDRFVSGWRLDERTQSDTTAAPHVFVGHGRSEIWRKLKEFLEQRLGLAVVEFNTQSAAGMSTTERLAQMLTEAQFAFLMFTGEDQNLDGTKRARENVVHEAGLFQGKLGFKRAIILFEEGCQEFSNIVGLVQIRFPVGDIMNAYEEIRRVLEREGIISSG